MEKAAISTERTDLGLIGILDVALQDSVLLVSTQGAHKQISLCKYPSMEFKGEFISKGNGPGEVLDPIFFGYARFHEEKDSLMLDIPNRSGDVVTWNVSKAFNDGTQETADKSLDISGNANYRFILNDSTVFTRSQSPDGLMLNREIYSSGRKMEIPALDILNKAYVTKNDGYSFNLLSGVPVYNDDLHVLADASLSTNVINFMSLDGSFSKSVVIGKKALKISEAERMLNLRQQLINYFL